MNMCVYPFGVYLRDFIHKDDTINNRKNYEFEAGDSELHHYDVTTANATD